MRKLMVFLTIFMLALSAGAREFVKGDQALKIYYSQRECQVLTPQAFLAKFAELNGIPNTDEAFRHLQAGKNYIIPVLEEKPVESIVQPVALAATEEMVEPESLEEEILPMLLAAAEEKVVALQEEVRRLTTQLKELPKLKNELGQKEAEVKGLELKLSTQESLAAQKAKQYEERIEGLIKEKGNSAYVLGSVVGLIAMLGLTAFLLYKISQLKISCQKLNSDRSRYELECRLRLQKELRQEMESELAKRLQPKTDEVNELKRSNGYMRRLLEERGYHFFHCPPGTIVKSSGKPIREVILKVVGECNGTPTVAIPSIDAPVPIRLIEQAFRSAEYRARNDSIVLPEMLPEPAPDEEPAKELVPVGSF